MLGIEASVFLRGGLYFFPAGTPVITIKWWLWCLALMFLYGSLLSCRSSLCSRKTLTKGRKVWTVPLRGLCVHACFPLTRVCRQLLMLQPMILCPAPSGDVQPWPESPSVLSSASGPSWSCTFLFVDGS